MKYTFETEINAPINRVAELAGNPDNRKKWMEGLESYEHVSGTPGTPGAKSRLVFKTGKVEITMIGTVMARNLPDELRDYLKTDFGIDFSAKNRNSLHEFLGFEIVT